MHESCHLVHHLLQLRQQLHWRLSNFVCHCILFEYTLHDDRFLFLCLSDTGISSIFSLIAHSFFQNITGINMQLNHLISIFII
jgi:hypothetical protein